MDVTIPGKKVELGHKHPMYTALDEFKEIFINMGFKRAPSGANLGGTAEGTAFRPNEGRRAFCFAILSTTSK